MKSSLLMLYLVLTPNLALGGERSDLCSDPIRASLMCKHRNDGELILDPAPTIFAQRPSSKPDFEGVRKDTTYFMVYQLAMVGLLYVAPEGISGWSEDQKEQRRFDIWWDNVNNPEWDEDDLWINYALHPYWGASYYVRARERGYGVADSFWYSALLSTMYEFGIEAIFENPSIQDVVVTPVVGSLLGRYFFAKRQRINLRAKTGRLSRKDRWVLALTDPLGAMNRVVDRYVVGEQRLTILPVVTTYRSPEDRNDSKTEVFFGVRVQIALD